MIDQSVLDATAGLSDLDVVTRTLDGEAGDQGVKGQQGVGNTLMRRAALQWQRETTVRGVCLHHEQYSCWLPGRDFERITAPDYVAPQGCVLVAKMVLDGSLGDITQGATHYFDDSIEPPVWADPARFTVKIGRLNFYNLGPAQAPSS